MKAKFPYYAVIFTSRRTEEQAGYAETSARMMELAARQPGYLGVDHAREEVGITVSYWESLEAIAGWKAQADHALAQRYGREKWYSEYRIRICRVEKEYGFNREGSAE
ncbi:MULTISPECIES: antibiotic biosynthesis monooxygenase family protein [unclassified Robiginitalea]|uniref:antibiotic biosynthesis monooxygenase family protein n=1 Tax=Robiginitalea TaxID=252306 RepID=UPI00234AA2ED|nr:MULTISPECIES: antibiotic biosynthesis monooxygenase [unclassified Robiginitalea]MDC6353023.1 antibiotic biosynthesis monooxygenase [Robiginitalea sp. PM2]MDC6373810.1 antibiotic biosynthesis monooxygenase [Robiginitalea sp. SP8]